MMLGDMNPANELL